MDAVTLKTITTDQLDQEMQRDVGLHVWNVLNDEWFKNELIPGSRRVPLAGLEEAAGRSSLRKDAAIVVYCAGPHCSASREAAEKLAELGYSGVAAFEGGLEHWKQAGRDVLRQSPTR
jgi:rhodanese-related sulfurtransferase